jgi:hypothetical protein
MAAACRAGGLVTVMANTKCANVRGAFVALQGWRAGIKAAREHAEVCGPAHGLHWAGPEDRY